MRIIVTTCNKARHLLRNFAVLFNRFMPDIREVTVFGYLPPTEKLPDNFKFVSLGTEDDPWSTQLLKVLNEVPDKFILLKEDFYLVKPVDGLLLKSIEDLFQRGGIVRLSLQSVRDGYENCVESYGSAGNVLLYRMQQNADYFCSFEAGMYAREFLAKYLVAGESSAQAENMTSARARNHGELVLVPGERILHYYDAMRGGEQRIKFDEQGWMYVLVPGDVWQNLDIQICE